MSQYFFRISRYVKHFLTSKNNYGHGIHSPFVYSFVQSTLHCEHNYYCFDKIENLRNENIKNKKNINISDYGTGSNRNSTVAAIAKTALQNKKNAQILFKIAHYIKAQSILELGTSLGISTAYLSSHNSKCHCISMEGAEEIALFAKQNHQTLGLNNIEIVIGDINQTLGEKMNKIDKLDLVYIDANHNYSSLMQYFGQILNKTHENSVVVIDDIYWSKGMLKAWNEIKQHPSTTCTIDTYYMGIVFFKPFLHKENFKLFF